MKLTKLPSVPSHGTLASVTGPRSSDYFTRPMMVGGLRAVQYFPMQSVSPYVVALSHGLWGDCSTLQNLATSLVKIGHEVVCLGMRGVPGSKRVANVGTITVGELESDIRDVVADIGRNRKLITVGHSMGALTSALASRNNQLVQGHISIASAPHRGVCTSPCVAWRIAAHLKEISLGKPLMLTSAEARALLGNTLDNADFVDMYHGLRPDTSRAPFTASCHLHHVGELDCRSLVIGYENDVICGGRSSQASIARKMRSRLIMLDGCHMSLVTHDGANEIARVIHNWITNENI